MIPKWAAMRYEKKTDRECEAAWLSMRSLAHDSPQICTTVCHHCHTEAAKCHTGDEGTLWAACRRCVHGHRLAQRLDAWLERDAYRRDPRPVPEILDELRKLLKKLAEKQQANAGLNRHEREKTPPREPLTAAELHPYPWEQFRPFARGSR